MTTLILIVFLLAANAFFVAAEFALVKVRHMRLSALANQGSRTAKTTLLIKENLEPYLAACQLGITMASLGLGWVGEPFVAALLEPGLTALGFGSAALHTTSFICGFVLFSSLHIVIGEQVPKTLAIRKPEPVSLWTAWTLRAFYIFAWPLNMALNSTSRALLRRMGIAEVGHDEVFSGAELSEMVATSHEHGHLGQGKADMIRNLFDFDRHTVRDVMKPRQEVDMLDLDGDPEQLWHLVKETGHSRFPVVRGGVDNVLGLLLVKDLFVATLASPDDVWTKVPDLVRPALIAPENVGVGVLFELMKNKRSHMALVVDEFGSFAGIVTLEDLIEEIVGEIDDELDAVESDDQLLEIEGGWRASGLSGLHDLDRALGTRLHEDANASSLSGFLMERIGRVPEVDDQVEEAGFRFCVETMEGRRVGRVRIEQPPAEGTAKDTAEEAS